VTARRVPDERGAALIFAIAFIVAVGAITAAGLAFVTSSVNQRNSLDTTRDREYAADGAIERAITLSRATVTGGAPLAMQCGGPYNTSLNGQSIRVDCLPAPALTRTGFVTRNAIFSACLNVGSACTDATTIIRAQVNYAMNGNSITRTYIQAWSVNQ
jgi:hypothetical protein